MAASSSAFHDARSSDKMLREAFKLFDTDGDDLISPGELATVMRSLGYHPTPDELRTLINSSEGAGQYTARGGLIDYDLFSRLMRQKARDEDLEGELKDAFRILDRTGQGYIDAYQMSLVCRALGEDLTVDEVKAMISEAISNFDDKIYYDGFVKTMISKHV